MQTYKKILLILMAISILSMITGYIIRHPVEVGLCPELKNWQDISCTSKYPILSVGKPLSIAPILPFLIFVILFFLPETFFHSWRWFALTWGVISLLWIANTSVRSPGIISVNRNYVAWATSILFFIISLLIIFYQTFVYYRKNKS